MSAEAIKTILQESEYLEKIGAWSASVSSDVRKKLTHKMIKRNDVIWELCKGERGYLIQLVVMSEFKSKYPPGFGSAEEFFPEWNELVSAHVNYLQLLIKAHVSSENYIVSNFGSVLMQAFHNEQVDQFSRMYGRLLAQQDVVKMKIERHKSEPIFAQYLQDCANNRSLGRKKLEDCFMVIYQRWTKVETQVQAIVDNTLNDPDEAEELQLVREQVRTILQRAEVVLGKRINAQQLDHYRQHFEITKMDLEREGLLSGSSSAMNESRPNGMDKESVCVALEMWQPEVELMHFSKISVQFTLRSKPKDGHAVLVNDLFFVLEEVLDATNKSARKRYRLMTASENEQGTSPIVLRFGEVQGFFREMNESRTNLQSQGKYQFLLLILLEKNSKMINFFCNTPDERTRWKTLFEAGFFRYSETPTQKLDAETLVDTDGIVEAGKQLEKRLQMIAQNHQQFERSLSDLEQLDYEIRTLCYQRRLLFQALFIDSTQHATGSGDSENLFIKRDFKAVEDAETRLNEVLNKLGESDNSVLVCCHEWIEHWNKQLRQLKLILCEGGLNLSRSVSNVERGTGRQLVNLKKTETFAGVEDTSIQDNCDGQTLSTEHKGHPMMPYGDTKAAKNKHLLIEMDLSKVKRSSASQTSTNSDYHSTPDGSYENVSQSIHEDERSLAAPSLDVDDSHNKIYFHENLVYALNEMHVAGVNTLKLVSHLHTRYADLQRRHQQQTEEYQSLQAYRQETESKLNSLQSRTSLASNSFRSSSTSGLPSLQQGPHSSSETALSTHSMGSGGASGGANSSTLPANNSRFSVSETLDSFGHQEGSGVLHASAQSTERLRIRILEFNKEKEKWLKESKQERMALEKAQMDLKQEKAKLEQELKKHNDEKQRLQVIIDMHNRRFGVDLREELETNPVQLSSSSAPFYNPQAQATPAEETHPPSTLLRENVSRTQREDAARLSMNFGIPGGNVMSTRSLSRDTLQTIDSELDKGSTLSYSTTRLPPSMPSVPLAKVQQADLMRNRPSSAQPFPLVVRGSSESDMSSSAMYSSRDVQRGDMSAPQPGIGPSDRKSATLTPNKQPTQPPSQPQQLPKYLASSTKVIKKSK